MDIKRKIPARRRFLTLVVMMVIAAATAEAQTTIGETKFNAICAACHTIGGGTRVGPDLAGVTGRRSAEWLAGFIASPQRMIDSGDPLAVQIRQQFPLLMPDPAVSATEIGEIIAYIRSRGAGSGAAPAMATATAQNISDGRDMFQGTRRFRNGGPACNSCHHVRNDAVIGGGVLARELTTVFGRMGAPGVQAILGRAPFPVMEQAFLGKALTDYEVFCLVAFLQDADRHHALQQPRDYGFKLLYSGVGGLAVLMGLYALFGQRRKKHPVYHKVFERQVKTQ